MLLKNNNILIIGCGSVGSHLLQNLILFIHENNISEELNIYLSDYDLLGPDNLPYLDIFNKDSDYLYKPKTHILVSIFSLKVKENVKLHSNPYQYDITSNVNLYDFVIDCRDTGDTLCNFDIKLNIDGDFGLINFGQKDINYKKNTGRYVYKNSNINTNIFTALVTKMIFDDNLMKKNVGKIYTLNIKEYLLNLTEVKYVI